MVNTVVLDYMNVFDNELDLTDGGSDEDRAITALAMAQDYFESVAAALPRVLQSTVNVSQVANTETSTWPSTLLRLDAVWFLDSATSRPVYKLKRITEVGGHVPALPWPLQVTVTPGTGAGRGYYANMNKMYWLPLPSGADSMRIYGMLSQTKISIRSGTFPYPDRVAPMLANFACRMLAVGVGDATADLDKLAATMFTPLLRAMRKFDRSEPMPKEYTDVHAT